MTLFRKCGGRNKYWLRLFSFFFFFFTSAIYDAVLCDHFTHWGYSTVPQEVAFLFSFFLFPAASSSLFTVKKIHFSKHAHGSDVMTVLCLHGNISLKPVSLNLSCGQLLHTGFFLLDKNAVLWSGLCNITVHLIASRVTTVIIHSPNLIRYLFLKTSSEIRTNEEKCGSRHFYSNHVTSVDI